MLPPAGYDPQILKERRVALRFPIATDLHYRIVHGSRDFREHTGFVENISSKGVAFRTAELLKPDWGLQMSIAWPVRLDGRCLLNCVLEGEIIRVQGELVVVTIRRTEFRTVGKGMVRAGDQVAARACGAVTDCDFRGPYA